MFDPKDRTAREIPTEVYIALVDSLYSDFPFFTMGVLVAFAGAFVGAMLTGAGVLYACAFAIIAIGALRGAHILSYRRRRQMPADRADARRWERAYEIGTSAYVLVLGVWCFITFSVVGDARASLISLAVSLAYIVGVTGRNYGSKRLVVLQLVLMGVPMVLGLLLVRDIASVSIALFLIPFLHGSKRVCDRLRDTLFNAVIATRDVQLLADRFDTALNNMPHGLAMFDVKGRLLVINRRWIEIFGLDKAVGRDDWSVDDLMTEAGGSGAASADEVAVLTRAFQRAFRASEPLRLPLENFDRSLDLTFQPMRGGGCVALLEDVTAKKVAEARLAHMARYDVLTGLPNRAQFQERLEAVLAGRRQDDAVCVMFVDIDRFKQINDTMGHAAGDTLLFEAAGRLRGVLRDIDTVARFGADEFVVLQHPCRDHKEAAAVASRIIQALAEPYDIDGSQVVAGASVGIAMAPHDGLSTDQLLKNADMALYRAKANGRGDFSFFERDMDTRAQARRQLETDLRKAMMNGELTPYYQPLYNIREDMVTSCEALLRWNHPERGFISPAEFIPVAEEMGLIIEIGAQTLLKACKECASWQSGQRVAVNVSSIQIHRGDIVESVEHALRQSGLDPRRLELEITESAFLSESEQTLIVLRKLRAMGVRVSLDDFGTGYSSLSYLRTFPLDKVKIDRSFLRDIEHDQNSLSLLRGVLRLSSELGLSVVVEGVETLQQLYILANDGFVDEVQGFLFSPALSAKDIRSILGDPPRILARVA
ncbi:putative bifunctional diguanylate cyclase/phosphodiesterase [Terrarubrum flagellatum]|uniref:putative bifunctional diguanylate cyclase/phosphodiesterase n=1 Tax=Terrirubrum flagellatum TaxID=2895980 RepID=UPI003145652F